MSFRSILSPSPSPIVSQPTANGSERLSQQHRQGNKVRSNSRQASLGNLFSDAWIAQPAKTRKPSGGKSQVAKAARVNSRQQPMYDIPLDAHLETQAKPLPRQRAFSDSSDSTIAAVEANEKHKRRGSSGNWEFHRLDSKRGWWVVLWAFMACFVSLSTLINYPIYEAYYINTTRESGALEDTNQGEGNLPRQTYLSTYVVLIGTLMSGFAALGSLGAGIASDVLGLRICALVGTLVLSLGLLSSAFLDRLWALCITQGVVSGIGIAMMAMPAYTAPSHWFERYRAVATGTAVAGTGLGVLALTPAYQAILRDRGLAVCLYVQTIITLVLGIGSSLGLRMRIDMPNQKPAFSKMKWRKVLSDLRVWALMTMAFFAAAARFAQLLCLPMFARAAGVEADTGGILYVMGAALFLGMIVGGAGADKTGYIAGIGLSELVLGIFTLVLYTPSSSVAPLYAFSAVFGLTTGTLAAVLPAAIAQMFGTTRLATSTGLVLAACAPALLATTPAALKFLHLLDKGSSTAWLSGISGVFSVIAGTIGMLLPVLQRRYIPMSPVPRKPPTNVDVLPESIETTAQFLEWYGRVESQLAAEQDAESHAYAERLRLRKRQCGRMVEETDHIERALCELREELERVNEQSSGVQEACSEQQARGAQLAQMSQEISKQLSVYQSLAPIAQLFNAPGDAVCLDPEFLPSLQRIEEATEFIAKHQSARDSELYLMRFAQCRTRGLTLIKMHAQREFRRLGTQLSMKEKSADVHVRFRTAAVQLRPLLEALQQHGQRDDGGTAQQVLIDVQQAYFMVRMSWLRNHVPHTLQVIEGEHGEDEAGMLRDWCAFMMNVCADERRLYTEMFGQEAALLLLREHEDQAMALFHEQVRPRIIRKADVESLAMLSLTLLTYQRPPASSDGDDSQLDAFYAAIAAVLQDAQQRLAFRAQAYVRSEISGYRLDRKDALAALEALRTSGKFVWEYPPVERLRWLAAQIGGCLDDEVQRGLTDEALAACKQNI
ncbi:Golgi transport complex subunit 3, partial [Coemansia brasiliensis]